jgi:hypothetical protein
MADEVYQTNIYNDNYPFHSFRKVLKRYGDVKLTYLPSIMTLRSIY